MEKNWKLKEAGDDSVVSLLADTLHMHPILASLLEQRGVRSSNDAKQFFCPDRKYLYPATSMADIQKAVDRLSFAVSRHEKILIYGDYDVDGITAVAMTYSFLKSQGADVDFYIPDRYAEGYGLSLKGIDYAKEQGVGLIITLDCGIKAVKKVAYGNSKGLDFIVSDHHYPGEELPAAIAVLNPKRADCPYPFKHLSGCGVGFKLLQAYCLAHNIPLQEVDKYLDLVALSIASDVVPMVGENRILAALGLAKLNQNPSLGLRTIIKLSGLAGKPIRVDDIIFKIGPRINAAGRMDRGYHAVQLLVTSDEKVAKSVATNVEGFNQDRKYVDSNITQEALRMLSRDQDYHHRNSTVLFNCDWHKGVVGIVASRLIETYYRPTVVLTRSNGLVTGSARSVDGFDLYRAIDACSSLLEDYGGHMFAAGVTMKEENVKAFEEKFEEEVSKSILEEQKNPHIEVDAELLLSDITPSFVEQLNRFHPFGPGNLPPVFVTRSVRIRDGLRVVGKNGEHIKLEVCPQDEAYPVLDAIGFQLADRLAEIRCSSLFDICYVLEENTFRGKTTIQLRIRDMVCSQ